VEYINSRKISYTLRRNYWNHKTETLYLIVFVVTVSGALQYVYISEFLIANSKNVSSFEVLYHRMKYNWEGKKQ